MSELRPPPARLLFRPDAFFIQPWRGWGVMRDGRGRILGRYETHGSGRSGSRSAFTEQVIAFRDGPEVKVSWEISTDDESHFYARDLATGVEAKGEQMGDDFCWNFTTAVPTKLGKLKAKTLATYTLITPTTAFAFAETRWFGMLLSSYATYYEQV
jgi:hypothetical protein